MTSLMMSYDNNKHKYFTAGIRSNIILAMGRISFFLAFIAVAVVCVMDFVVWNKRGLDIVRRQDAYSNSARTRTWC